MRVETESAQIAKTWENVDRNSADLMRRWAILEFDQIG